MSTSALQLGKPLIDGVARVVLESDYRAWQKKLGQLRHYANRYPRVQSGLSDEHLPSQVIERARFYILKNPYWHARKYYMDVTEAQWKAIRDFVFERDGGICVYCGDDASVIDHVLPISRLGSWHPSNCVSSCATCNGRKSNKTPKEWGDK